MGSSGDFLFGSTNDARQVGRADLLTEGQSSLLSQLTGLLRGQLGQGVESYQETYTPGLSDLQTRSMDLVSRILGGDGVYGQTEDALSSFLEPYDSSAARDYWSASVADPMMRQWEDEILPAVQEAYISRNAGSSGAANRAIAKSGADLASDMNASLARILYQDEQTHKADALTAAGQSMDMGALLSSLGLSAGGLQRDVASEQLLED